MSMQIVEKSGEGLSRVYGVKVSAKDLGDKLDARIAEIAPQMNLKGFRPGKVPLAHVRRMYGKSLMGEVIEQTINESSAKVLEDYKLRVAAQPDLKADSDMDQVFAGKSDLSFEIQVEVMPEFEPLDPKTLKLQRPVYKPTDKEIDEAVEELAKANRTYETRTGKTVKAKDGDQVIIDFVGRMDGVEFEGGAATDTPLVLGSKRFIPGYEEQLVGAKPGETRIVKITFPEDYQAANLRGKEAEFEVTVKDVQAPVETPIDDDFAKALGMDTLEALKEAVAKQVGGEYENASRFKLKRALLDALDKGHDFPLPPRMVDAEFNSIWQQVEADKAEGDLPPEDAGKSDDELKSEYRKIAERRVRLGLVLAEIGRKHEVVVGEDEVLQAIRMEALKYRGQEQQVFDALRQNKDAQAQLRAPIYEDKVVDLLFSEAKITDKKVSKAELMKEDDMPEGYGG